MVNHRMRAVTDAVTHPLQAPAQVDFFHVCEKVGVESAGELPKRLFDEKSSSAGPEDIASCVILPQVLFQYMQHTPAAEGETITIDEPARRTGMFKVVALVV